MISELKLESCTDVLLFGTMGNIGPVVRDDFVSHGLSVRLVDFPQNTLRDEPGYRRELRKVLERCQAGCLMPIGSQLALAGMRAELPADLAVPVENVGKLALLDDKVRCSELAAYLGIPQPVIYRDADDVRTFPVIFKRASSFGGSGVYRPRSREALQRLMAHEPGGRFLIEELIDGDDYSVDVVRWHGYTRFGCYKTLSQRGHGPSVERMCVSFPKLGELALRILEYLDYNGVCGMDFRVDCDGNLFFLECNPRFTGGIETQIENGFDIPYILYQCIYNIIH